MSGGNLQIGTKKLCRLFYDTQYPEYIVLNGRMPEELERIWKDAVMA
jgi:hypothetical protein